MILEGVVFFNSWNSGFIMDHAEIRLGKNEKDAEIGEERMIVAKRTLKARTIQKVKY